MNWRLKITELVDKDIAENSKPISLLGILVPWLPFLFFAQGAPIDRYPILSGVALGLSIGWLVFVAYRFIRYTKKELAPYHRSMGPARFWALMAGTLLAILLIAAALAWLEG